MGCCCCSSIGIESIHATALQPSGYLGCFILHTNRFKANSRFAIDRPARLQERLHQIQDNRVRVETFELRGVFSVFSRCILGIGRRSLRRLHCGDSCHGIQVVEAWLNHGATSARW